MQISNSHFSIALLLAMVAAVLFTTLYFTPAEARQSDEPQLIWPVTYPEYFIEDYILDGEVIIQEHERANELIQGMSHAGLRVTRNAIFARHGFQFESPDLDHYFSRTRWFQAAEGPITLNRADSLNVAYILELEQNAPELPEFDALFPDVPYHHLRKLDLGPGYIHGHPYIPAELVRKYLDRPDYTFEFDFTYYAPLKKLSLPDDRSLYIYTTTYGVGQTYHVITRDTSGEPGPPTDIDLFLGDQEVGGDKPIITESQLYADSYGTLYIIQIQSQDYEEEIDGETRYLVQKELLVRAHLYEDLKKGEIVDAMDNHNEKETLLYILYGFMNEKLENLLEHPHPERVMAHQLTPLTTRALWIIKNDEVHSAGPMLKTLKETFPEGFGKALLYYREDDREKLRAAVGEE